MALDIFSSTFSVALWGEMARDPKKPFFEHHLNGMSFSPGWTVPMGMAESFMIEPTQARSDVNAVHVCHPHINNCHTYEKNKIVYNGEKGIICWCVFSYPQ